MKILIQTPGLKNQSTTIDFLKDMLSKKYSERNYINGVKASIKLEKPSVFNVGILLEMIQGRQIYAASSGNKIHEALKESVHKIDQQLKKFKEKNIEHPKQ